MTERGLPTEGAPACPFVAFEDDRDGRSTAPDHRHRCFAEPRPAPRALAHQEAYCLSSAFPVCPTFQDWARREAAAARPSAAAAAPAPAPAREETPPPQSRPLPPVEREGRHAPANDVPSIPPRRSQQREWAAPPPWVDEGSGRGAGDEGPGGPGAGFGAGAAAAGAGFAAGAGASGFAAADRDRDRADRDLDEDDADAAARDEALASRGLAGSAAYRLAGPDPAEPPPAQPERDDRFRSPAAHDRYLPPERRSAADDDLDDEGDDDWAAGEAGAGAYVAGSATARTTAGAARYEPPARRDAAGRREAPGRRGDPARRDNGDARNDRRSQDARRRDREQDAQELFGPAWERPRRYEAYPKLSTRVGLPAGLGGVPKVALWGGLLLVAALAIFLLGPRLLGLSKGNNGAGGDATPTPTATSEPTVEPTATPVPEPTAQVYRVAKGDTISKIAKKFGLTVQQLLDANPQIKNPDKIKVGDPVTIPVPVEDGGQPTDGSVGGASQAP